VVAPWIRGYKPSPRHGPYDPARLGEDAAELAAALAGHGKALLVGHDWGAVAGWYAAAQAPQHLAAFVALSVPHPIAFARNLPRHPRQLLRSWYVGFFQLPWLPERLLRAGDFAAIDALYRRSSVPRGRPLPYRDDLVTTLRESLPGPLGPYRALRHNRPPRALRVRVPTLYLAGARDPAVGVEMARGQERHVDAAFEGRVLPDAGHFLHHDRPDEVAAAILGFVRNHAPAGG
jgi:pimeloyl-ACP methyl ester carboxylesterase